MIRFTHFSRMTSEIARNVICFLMMASGFVSSAITIASEPVLNGRTNIRISDISVSDLNISLKTQLNYYTALN